MVCKGTHFENFEDNVGNKNWTANVLIHCDTRDCYNSIHRICGKLNRVPASNVKYFCPECEQREEDFALGGERERIGELGRTFSDGTQFGKYLFSLFVFLFANPLTFFYFYVKYPLSNDVF